jgi:hypothetical protein
LQTGELEEGNDGRLEVSRREGAIDLMLDLGGGGGKCESDLEREDKQR